MSKILEAMRRAGTAAGTDFSFQLATVDGARLYPVPPPSQLGEFEQLASALITRHDGTNGQVVVFASTTSGEGASYVSYNVARHLSYMLDRKVAWVDANFRSPQRKLADEGVDFRSLLENPSLFPNLKTAGNLVLIPNGHAPIKSTDLLNSENWPALLEHFQRTFYFTIIDAPPILDSGDVAHLAAPALGLVLVIESRRLKHEIIRHGLDQLQTLRVNILGSVLNKRTFDIPAFLYKRL
jgi:Mrp family chromosome partitioning ATPase